MPKSIPKTRLATRFLFDHATSQHSPVGFTQNSVIFLNVLFKLQSNYVNIYVEKWKTCSESQLRKGYVLIKLPHQQRIR